MSLVDDTGMLDMTHNWFKPGWVSTFNGSLGGVINDDGTTIVGASPGFTNESSQDFTLGAASPLRDRGAILHAAALPANDLTREYVKHRNARVRVFDGSIDVGAFEYAAGQAATLRVATTALKGGRVGAFYAATLAAAGGLPPYRWSLAGAPCHAGCRSTP